MSIDSADIDNNLSLEVYSTQITGDFFRGDHNESQAFSSAYCQDLSNPEESLRCLQNITARPILSDDFMSLMRLDQCKLLDTLQEQEACYAMVLFKTAMRTETISYCDKINKNFSRTLWACKAFFLASSIDSSVQPQAIPQIQKANVLLTQTEQGNWIDKALDFNIHHSGWSWNSKFADLDNDSWQDLYVANGGWFLSRAETNIFFRNINGKRFEKSHLEYGLEDFKVTGSYTYTDIDRDGDLDIVSNPLNADLQFFINGEDTNSAISFELQDTRTNYYGINAKVIIFYGQGKHQIREIKSSGGFHSFDPYMAYFGLSQSNSIERLCIVWPDGSKTEHSEKLQANHHYKIIRK